jgi:hypothetical protein
MKKILILMALLLGAAGVVSAQVPVSLAPVPRQQFSDVNGNPLPGGLIFTYAAGTSTPLATYTDSSGTSQNSNPVVLDSGGFATLWLSAAPYKICLQNALGVQQWCVDNVTQPGLALLSTPNSWNSLQTFGPCDIAILPGPVTVCSTATGPRQASLPDNTGPIAETNIDNLFSIGQTITATLNQLKIGASPNQTILNFPAPAGSITLNFPTTAGTVLTGNSPAITTPTINGASTGTGVSGTDPMLATTSGITTTGLVCGDANGGITTTCSGGTYKVECTSTTSVTVTNLSTQQSLITCPISAGEIARIGEVVRIRGGGTLSNTSGSDVTFRISGLVPTIIGGLVTVTNGSTLQWISQVDMVFSAVGATGSATVQNATTMASTSGATSLNSGTFGTGSAFNTTASNNLGFAITMGTASPAASITETYLIIERLN